MPYQRRRYPARHRLTTHNCLWCRRDFVPGSTTHLFCSHTCNLDFNRGKSSKPCLYCGSPRETYDHVIPRAWEPYEHPERVHACKSCNSIMGGWSDLEPFTFEGRLLRLARVLETKLKLPSSFPNTEHPNSRLRHLAKFYLAYIRGGA